MYINAYLLYSRSKSKYKKERAIALPKSGTQLTVSENVEDMQVEWSIYLKIII